MPVNTGYLGSNQTSDYVSNMSQRNPVWMFSTLSVLGAARFGSTLSADGAMTMQGAQTIGSTLSVGGAARFGSTLSVDGAVTLNAALTGLAISGTQFSASSADFMSIVTAANSSSMTRGELRIIHALSGFSLVYSSGATVYTIGASAVSAAQA